MFKIRPFVPEDSGKIVSWFSDSLSFYQWSAGRLGGFPIEPQTLSDYYADSEKCDGAMPFTAFDENGIAGHFIIRFLDEEKKHTRLGFIVIDSARRGQNLGGRMLSLAIAYCKIFLKAERITLAVFENNPSAIRCYEKAGFAAGETEVTEVNGEQWQCIQMEHVF